MDEQYTNEYHHNLADFVRSCNNQMDLITSFIDMSSSDFLKLFRII